MLHMIAVHVDDAHLFSLEQTVRLMETEQTAQQVRYIMVYRYMIASHVDDEHMFSLEQTVRLMETQ
jgi:hypothetical protein